MGRAGNGVAVVCADGEMNGKADGSIGIDDIRINDGTEDALGEARVKLDMMARSSASETRRMRCVLSTEDY